jgi:hypothetical protein
VPRIRRYLGPQVSMRTLYRRVRLVAIWRRLFALIPLVPFLYVLTGGDLW